MSKISIADIFARSSNNNDNHPSVGMGVVNDIHAWVEKYNQHLITTAKSKTTISNYNKTLKALAKYISKYHQDLTGIDMILEHINSFLEWMEDYKISSQYGSIEERITHLLHFISPEIDFENYKTCAYSYLTEIDDEIYDSVEYVIMDYYTFLYNSADQSINKASLRSYVEKRERVSNATMQQHRISMIAFLKYVDSCLEAPVFALSFKNIKQYPIQKDAHKYHKGLSEKDDALLQTYIFAKLDYFMALKRKLHWKEYSLFRTICLIIVMRFAGLRVSEAVSLRFSDIEILDGQGTARLNVVGKGNKKGRVPIRRDMIDVILDIYKENKHGDYLSSGYNGKPMTRGNLYVSVKTILSACEIQNKGLHIFRHTYGSVFVSQNGNIAILQSILRHSKITTTSIYASVTDKAMADAVANLSMQR